MVCIKYFDLWEIMRSLISAKELLYLVRDLLTERPQVLQILHSIIGHPLKALIQ